MAKNTHNEITILVVDDDKKIAGNLSEYLTNSGYTTTIANTGKKGLALLKQQHHDIALVDLKLPDSNGIELLKSFKANSPKTIIILISGYATIDAAAESIKCGAYDFLSKPFNFEELEQILHRAIERKTQTEKLNQLKTRNILLALTLPLWALLGYLLFSYF